MRRLALVCAAGVVLPLAACELVGSIDDRVLAAPNGGGGRDTCAPGERRACYAGPPETRGVGACRDGEQVCGPEGWGPCDGGRGPAPESCLEAADLDCDGTPSCVGTPRWLARFGDAAEQYARDGTVLADGRFVVVGVFEGTLELGDTTLVSLGGFDIFVAAFNPDGTVSWAVSFGGPGGDRGEFFDVALAPDGDLVVVGTLNGQATFGATTLVPDGLDGVAFRLSPEGEPRWAVRIGGAGDQLIRGVSADPRGLERFVLAGHYDTTFMVGGRTHSTSGGRRRVLYLRLDGDGTPQWSADHGGSSDVFGGAVAVGAQGDFWTTGNARGSVDLGGGELVPPGAVVRTSFLGHFAADGTPLGSWIHGVSGYSQGEEIALLPGGDVLVSGAITTSGTVDFGDGVQGGEVSRQVFLARFDPAGAPVASRLVPGGLGTPALRVDAQGFITLGAIYTGPTSFGGSPLTAGDDWDAAIVKYDAMLSHRWSRGGFGPGKDDTYALGVTEAGEVFAAGRFVGSLTLDAFTLTGAGGPDLWVGAFAP